MFSDDYSRGFERRMKLNRLELKELATILPLAFPRIDNMRQMLKYYLGVNLEDITQGKGLKDTAFDLTDWAESHGKIEDLLFAAIAGNPSNYELRRFIRQEGKIEILEEQLATQINRANTAASHVEVERKIREELETQIMQIDHLVTERDQVIQEKEQIIQSFAGNEQKLTKQRDQAIRDITKTRKELTEVKGINESNFIRSSEIISEMHAQTQQIQLSLKKEQQALLLSETKLSQVDKSLQDVATLVLALTLSSFIISIYHGFASGTLTPWLNPYWNGYWLFIPFYLLLFIISLYFIEKKWRAWCKRAIVVSIVIITVELIIRTVFGMQ